MNLHQTCAVVIKNNPKTVADHHAGNKAAIKFLTGQVMRVSKGTANPARAMAELGRRLK